MERANRKPPLDADRNPIAVGDLVMIVDGGCALSIEDSRFRGTALAVGIRTKYAPFTYHKVKHCHSPESAAGN